MNNVLIHIGKKIRLLRIENNLSQEKLSELTDLDRSYINSIENGKRNLSILVLIRILDVLKINTSDFFKDIENEL